MNKNSNCIFCNPTNIIIDSQYAYSRLDGFHVSKGHCLIIPKRHIQSIFELTNEELKDLYGILKQTYDYLINCGYNMDIILVLIAVMKRVKL